MPAKPQWTISVTQLNEYVRRMLSGDPMLRSVHVCGELSGCKKQVSGHWYFTLKDENARVQCAMFRQNALYLNFQPKDGMRVTVTASASLYSQNGAYQLYVERMEQEGAGELHLRFEALKQRLGVEGLFDPSIKKQLPMLPKVIGVVTSRSGAVLRDIVRVARRRDPNVSILLAACSVQGTGAAQEIADALDRLNRDGRAEVILCGRGGGSTEDLWAFNEEIVARAIARSRIPVVSCVGHETDFTIADFVADLRAPTPSAAAELSVPQTAQLSDEVEVQMIRMTRALMTKQMMLRAKLERLSESALLKEPRRMLIEARSEQVDRGFEALSRSMETMQMRCRNRLHGQLVRLMGVRHLLSTQTRRRQLDMLEMRLHSAMEQRMRTCRRELMRMTGAIENMNPEAVLLRGYAAVYADGRTLNDAGDVRAGQMIEIRMRGGVIRAVVDSVNG
jgi:exodeoxyribonuclease VII large subunit